MKSEKTEGDIYIALDNILKAKKAEESKLRSLFYDVKMWQGRC